MASNSSGKHRVDNEIEKFRLELNWTKILDKLKTNKVSDYGKFLEGESQFELYLQQYPLLDNARSSIEHNEEHLNRIENLLKSNQSFQSRCLLAKLFHLKSNDEQCLFYLNSALNSIPQNIDEQPNRTSLLLAEMFSLKGILFEKKQENIFDIIKAFDDSCKLSQIYYSAVEKAKHLNNENLDIENSLIEIAYQRLPLLYASHKNLSKAIEIFRSSIENLHIKSFETMRQTLIKQYAQLLIKCVCQSNYLPIDSSHHQQHRNDQQQFVSTFIPRNVDEEICLLLMLSQNATLNEAVLDWQPEYEKQRERSHQSAYHILSLLAIFFSRKQAFHLIVDSYEQALRFSFEHFQTWYNYALSLISSGQSFRAYFILKECVRMQPNNIQVYQLLAKIILQDIYDVSSIFEQNSFNADDYRSLIKFHRFEYSKSTDNFFQSEHRPPFIQLIDEAIDFCEKATNLSARSSARSIFLLGLAKSFKSRQTSIHQTRLQLFQSAVELFRESIQLDPHDSLVYFHLAQNLAFLNQIDDAIKSIDQCLDLSPDDRDALHLRSILLTAQKQFVQAYQQIYRATHQYEDLTLLLSKARIEEDLYGYQQSIITCKEALIVWKKKFQSIIFDDQRQRTFNSKNVSTTNRSQNVSINFDIDNDQSMKSSLTSKHDEQTNNSLIDHLRLLIGFSNDEQFNSHNRTSNKSVSISTIHFQFIQIFEYLIRYYIELNQLDESEDCLKVFSSIDHSSHQFYYFRGLISNARHQYQMAKQYFNDGLAINPHHFPTLIQLTKLLIDFGNYSLAEKYARDAIAIQPSNHQPWYLLSLSMEARGEYEQSIDVAATAVQLEQDSPTISYNSIVRVL